MDCFDGSWRGASTLVCLHHTCRPKNGQVEARMRGSNPLFEALARRRSRSAAKLHRRSIGCLHTGSEVCKHQDLRLRCTKVRSTPFPNSAGSACSISKQKWTQLCCAGLFKNKVSIQLQVPLQLPCYNFIRITLHRFEASAMPTDVGNDGYAPSTA